MTPRDCMVYAGVLTSEKLARLNWFERDFFRGLLHVCDDYGNFEANAALLRAVLYAPILGKVRERDVNDALLRCAEPGIRLVRLYTVQGRGYGNVINYRQTNLKKRRALYPGEDQDEPDLFTSSPPSTADPPEQKKERKKEGGRARGAAPALAPYLNHQETETEWIARLEREWPKVNVREQLIAALDNRSKKHRRLERAWFESHWLPYCSETYSGGQPAPQAREPEGWREWMVISYPGCIYVKDGKCVARFFTDLPEEIRMRAIEALRASA